MVLTSRAIEETDVNSNARKEPRGLSFSPRIGWEWRGRRCDPTRFNVDEERNLSEPTTHGSSTSPVLEEFRGKVGVNHLNSA